MDVREPVNGNRESREGAPAVSRDPKSVLSSRQSIALFGFFALIGFVLLQPALHGPFINDGGVSSKAQPS